MEERRVAYSPQTVSAAGGRRISWGALFAGAVTAIVVQLLLTLLGLSIGAASVESLQNVGAGLGIGAGIWLAVSMIIAMFCGGWVAARTAGIPRKTESILHGGLSWGVTTVAVLLMVGTALGNLLGAAVSTVTNLVSVDVGGGVPPIVEQFQQQVQQQGGGQQGAQAQGGQGAQGQQQVPTGPIAGSAFGAFLIMLLSGGAGALGGWLGTPKNLILTSLPAFERRKAATPSV